MFWFRRKGASCSFLRAQLQQLCAELQQAKIKNNNLLGEQGRVEQSCRRLSLIHNSELALAKANADEHKHRAETLLADKAKLQSELIEHLKLLRASDERLDALRRDLADSEFELDQLRIALGCTTEYSLRLESDQQAAETTIRLVCGELNELLAAVATAEAASTMAGNEDAAEATVAASPPFTSRQPETVAAAALRTRCLVLPGGDGTRVAAGAASLGPALGAPVGRQSDGGPADGASMTAAAAVPATAAATLVIAERLRSVRQRLHALVVDPAIAAAATAVGTVTPCSKCDEHGACANGGVGGHCSGSPSPPMTPPPPAAAAAVMLLQACKRSTAQPRRAGNAAHGEYDAGGGGRDDGLGDHGHRRRRTGTSCVEAAALAGIMLGSRGRGCGSAIGTAAAVPGAVAAIGGGGSGGPPWASPPASVPLTPLARLPPLVGLSGAVCGWGGTGGDGAAVHRAVVVRGRGMGAASLQPSAASLSLLPSPTRSSDGSDVHVLPPPPSTLLSPRDLTDTDTAAPAAASAAVKATAAARNEPALAASGDKLSLPPWSPPGTAAAEHGPGMAAAGTRSFAAKQQQQRQHATVPDWDSELVWLRLTNEALQRQVAELQRQNDLLQLRQLGGGGGSGGTSSCQQHPHCDYSYQCGVTGPNGGAPRATAVSKPSQPTHQHAATAAAAAAAASPFSSPLAAPYYYGSLPPGRQQPAAGGAEGGYPTPTLFPLFGEGTIRSGGGACGGGGPAGATAAAAAPSARAVAPAAGVLCGSVASITAGGGAPLAVDHTRASGGWTAHTTAEGGSSAGGRNGGLALAGEGAEVPAAVSEPDRTPLPVASKTHGSAAAARIASPPGVDPALWELEMLIAFTKSGGAGMVQGV